VNSIRPPAPEWGVFAALQRGLMDSFLTYLPVYLLGRVPPKPSNLFFIPDEEFQQIVREMEAKYQAEHDRMGK